MEERSPKRSPVRFLIVRFSAIGDCVMAAHAATGIRRAYPDSHIAWAVETRCAAVVDRQTLTNKVVDFPRDRWKKSRWSPAMWADQLRTFGKLRNQNYDYGIDLQGHSKTALCLLIAKPKKKIATAATDALARKLTPVAPNFDRQVHNVERYLQVVRELVEIPHVPHPIMPVPAIDQPLPENLVTISVSAGAADKAYPLANWETVAKRLLDGGYAVAFLGGPTDPHPTIQGVLDLVGKLPLEQSMAAIAKSKLHLAGDTGGGHIAAAYQIPVVSVFGPTNPNRFRPYTDQGIVLREGKRPDEVIPDQVIEAALKLAKEARAQIPD